MDVHANWCRIEYPSINKISVLYFNYCRVIKLIILQLLFLILLYPIYCTKKCIL